MAQASFHHGSHTVCVMEASGRLASTLVDRLLKRGYIVHAAVQTPGSIFAASTNFTYTKMNLFVKDVLC